MASIALLLAPDILPQKKKDQIGYLRWEKMLARFNQWRGGYRKTRKLSRGGAIALWSNKGNLNTFDLGDSPHSDEIYLLLNICKAFPGEYLGLWSFGHALTMLHLQATTIGHRPAVKEMSLRLAQLNGVGRRAERLSQLQAWFTDSVFEPDFVALQQQYEASEISVQAWFAAFGISEAKEIESNDSQTLWQDFEEVTTSLLRGEKAPTRQLRSLNKQIRLGDESTKLPTKPAKYTGDTARRVADAFYQLEELLDLPQSKVWQARLRASTFYWDISDCDDAWRRLTLAATYPDKKGIASSASDSRLAVHYPADLMRDSIFWALAGLETEGANGNPTPYFCLAESVHQAGFSLIIFPVEKQADFRQYFGLVGREGQTPLPEHAWTAELFIDITNILLVDPLPELQAWFATSQSNGMLLRAEADGTWQIRQFKAGELLSEPAEAIPGGQIKAPATLTQAAKNLDPRAIFTAVGLPDLLEPGEWHEGAYGGVKDEAEQKQERIMAAEMLSRVSEPITLQDWKQIQHDFPHTIRFKQDQIALCLTFPQPDKAYQKSFLEDLRGESLAEEYGQVWSVANQVWALTDHCPETAVLVRVLGDTPPGTQLAIGSRQEVYHYQLSPDAQTERPEFASCLFHYPGEAVNTTLDGQEFYNMPLEGVQCDHHYVTDAIYEGKECLFLAIDTSDILFKTPDLVDQLNQNLRLTGMTKLGDFACVQSPIFMRGFVNQAHHTYGVMIIPVIAGKPVVEFYTLFDAGVVSSSNQQVAQWLYEIEQQIEQAAYWQAYQAEIAAGGTRLKANLEALISTTIRTNPEGLNEQQETLRQQLVGVDSLWQQHQQRVKNQISKGQSATEVAGTLLDLVQIKDRFFWNLPYWRARGTL